MMYNNLLTKQMVISI